MQTASAPPSYRRDDWQRGYESQKQEFDYAIVDIEGRVPPELNGTLYRNGPGMLDVNGERIHHPFDGDGMISAFRFDRGQVRFRNRYIRTAAFEAEQKAGKILYRGVFGTKRRGGPLANAFDFGLKNIANTNIVQWGDKLLALWEAAEPYRLDPETLETIGLDNLNGLLKPGDSFAAHPRIDPGSAFSNGEVRLVNFAVKTGLSSAISLFEFDQAGTLVQQQIRQVPGFAFMHDMVLTPNYYVFFQNPVKFNPLPFLFGFRSAGQCLESDPKGSTSILLIPRDPSQPVRTIAAESCFVFHHANGFEVGEGSEAKLYIDSICYDGFPMVGPDVDFLDLDFTTIPPGQLYRFEVDLAAGTVSRRSLEPRCCEFPSLNPDKVGQDARYLYIGVTAAPSGNAPLQAIEKLDLQTEERQIYAVGPRCFISEPLFVPRPGAEAEDDGWVLCLIYNAERHASDLLILNAQTWQADATLKLQQHIPYGLHGSFVPRSV
jgi:all-trans-8'-apo-beta-carotenal 15,15'-oxygenase